MPAGILTYYRRGLLKSTHPENIKKSRRFLIFLEATDKQWAAMGWPDISAQALYSNYTFLYKQTVYKQLALGWQIVKHFSRLNPFSLSNNKN